MVVMCTEEAPLQVDLHQLQERTSSIRIVTKSTIAEDLGRLDWRKKSVDAGQGCLKNCREWRDALMPEDLDIWSLETDLGIVLAAPFQETLRRQLEGGKKEGYLLTKGLKQDSTFQIAWASLADLSYQKNWISTGEANRKRDKELEELEVRKYFFVVPHFRRKSSNDDSKVEKDMESRFAQTKYDVFRSAVMKSSAFMALLTAGVAVHATLAKLWVRTALLWGLIVPLYAGYSLVASRRGIWKRLAHYRVVLLFLLGLQSASVALAEWDRPLPTAGLLLLHTTFVNNFSPLGVVEIFFVTAIGGVLPYLILTLYPDWQINFGQPGHCNEEPGAPAALLQDIVLPPFVCICQFALAIWRDETMRLDFLLRDQLQAQRRKLKVENEKSEDLLKSMLPQAIIDSLKRHEPVECQDFQNVTVIFVQVCDFSVMCSVLPATTIVQLLDKVFQELDRLSDLLKVHKVETVGDVYMAVSGCPHEIANHADVAAHFAIAAQSSILRMRASDVILPQGVKGRRLSAVLGEKSLELRIRIGMNSGRIRAGVVGLDKPRFKLFGDTVNTASRMESTSEPGCTQISEATKAILGPEFNAEERGLVEVKGKGALRTYYLRSYNVMETDDSKVQESVTIKVVHQKGERTRSKELLENVPQSAPGNHLLRRAAGNALKELVSAVPAQEFQIRSKSTGTGHLFEHSSWKDWVDMKLLLVSSSSKRPDMLARIEADKVEYKRVTLDRRIFFSRTLIIGWHLMLAFTALLDFAFQIPYRYEAFLTQIRNRIVCAEDDVLEASMEPCDSMKDGPFCRGLPEMGMARHRPFTLDSTVPQHLFGDPHQKREADPAREQAVQATMQATNVLNRFLEHFSKLKDTRLMSVAVEGRLDFQRLGWEGIPVARSFSAGLPPHVVLTWEGPWQVEPFVEPPTDSLNQIRRATKRSAKRRPRAAVRLNGVIGALRFSRPVVVRSLQLRPSGADASHFEVRGRLAGAEVWRRAYERRSCGIGELVLGRWEGDGQYYYARILASHAQAATVLWIDRDPSHRLVSWEHLVTPEGAACKAQQKATLGLGQEEWLDMARRTKAVDELAFISPSTSVHWILGELHVSAARWAPDDVGDESVRMPPETGSRVVQVLPGPHASIEEASQSALFYNADDMLERGLQLKSWVRGRSSPEPRSEPRKGSQKLQMSAFRSVEGLKQMVKSLMLHRGRPSLRRPAHMSQARVLTDLDYLVTTMNVGLLAAEDQEKVVRRYGHFEIFFADLWDWRAPVDSLQVLYEQWRQSPVMQEEAKGIFQEGQSWQGTYYCTQGRTKFSLDVTEAHLNDGHEEIRADLTFTIAKKGGNVTGIYEVLGRLEPRGRGLNLEPIPDSWKVQPKNFVMVGTQGVVSLTDDGTGRHLYAGTVPIYGCDSFELYTEAKAPEEHRGPALWNHWINSAWNGALQRLVDTIDINRQSWRRVLQRIMTEKPKTSSNDVAQIFEAARQAGLVSVEFTGANGDWEQYRLGVQARTWGVQVCGWVHLGLLMDKASFDHRGRLITVGMLALEGAAMAVLDALIFGNDTSFFMLYGLYVLFSKNCPMRARLTLCFLSLTEWAVVDTMLCDWRLQQRAFEHVSYTTVVLLLTAAGIRMQEHLDHCANYYERHVQRQIHDISDVKRGNQKLLSMILPSHVVQMVSDGISPIAEDYPNVSVVFTDLQGFTAFSSRISPMELVELLNLLYSAFDEIIMDWGVHKVEVIGDAYFISSGCPVEDTDAVFTADEYAMRAVEVALALQRVVPSVCDDNSVQMRCGIHTGNVIAGVVGKTGPRFHLFGPTVEYANRMESTGLPGKVQISDRTKQWLDRGGHDYIFEDRIVEIAGQEERTFLVTRSKARAARKIRTELAMHRHVSPHAYVMSAATEASEIV
ncbi:Soluble guanylate cyclase 88E [Durusdinium trenchii]|uniref:Soluble guanylate cyclase 88E n=1 Tax=Durusdinium trenchii TaxID=1381693 RepID=A0ABP0IR48_9DINO